MALSNTSPTNNPRQPQAATRSLDTRANLDAHGALLDSYVKMLRSRNAADSDITKDDTPNPAVKSASFPGLPFELRKTIWHLAMPPPRTHFVEVYGYCRVSGEAPQIRYIPPLPALFHTTRESRRLSIRRGGGEMIRFRDDYDRAFYFSFGTDVMFLSSRFLWNQGSSETERLRLLGELLAVRDVARVQRVVVTFAATDDCALVGQACRPFKGIRKVYLAKQDRYSVGRVKWGVDEESEVERLIRLAGRARRHFVEVELGLQECSRPVGDEY